LTTAAVVLAAGLGRRLPGKLRAPFRGRPLAQWAFGAAADAGLDELLVVVGQDGLADLLPPGASAVANPRAAEGQATSLAAGIAAADAAGHDAVVVGLADQPLVPPEAWRLVAGAPAEGLVVTAAFAGERRPPVRLHRSVWPLLPTSGDEGARALFRDRPDLVVEVPCPGDPGDIDTLEDLERWK
jgi:CTP:molybdopterin cytidylyltransferase MocA